MNHPVFCMSMCMCMYMCMCRLNEALLQNSIADITAADLDQLGEEEAEGLAGSSSGAAGGGSKSGTAGAAGAAGSSAGSGGAHKQERGGLIEAQTFSDLAFSKNKVG
jgi:hypothetical protein